MDGLVADEGRSHGCPFTKSIVNTPSSSAHDFVHLIAPDQRERPKKFRQLKFLTLPVQQRFGNVRCQQGEAQDPTEVR